MILHIRSRCSGLPVRTGASAILLSRKFAAVHASEQNRPLFGASTFGPPNRGQGYKRMPMAADALTRSLRLLADEGLPALLRRDRRRLVSFPELILYEKHLRGLPRRPVTPPSPDVEFNWLEPSRLVELYDPDLECDAGDIAAAWSWLARGDRCLVGTEQGQVVHYHWITTSVREHPGLKLALGPGVAVCFRAFTRPAYRGRGLNSTAHSISEAASYAAGIRRLLREVYSNNIASQRSVQKDGYREVGRFRGIRLMRYQRLFMSADLAARYTEGASAI